MAIIVRFIKGEGFVSDGIAFVTNSIFSHVEFGTPEGTWIGAHDDGGIQERPADYCAPTRDYRYSIPCTPTLEAKFLAAMRADIGTKYNVADIVGLLLHDRNLNNPATAICSEWVTSKLVGFFGADQVLNVLPNRTFLISPETLHLSPIFVGRMVSSLPEKFQ